MLNQNTHTYIEREPGQIRRLSYQLQYFFISDSVKVKLSNNRLHTVTVCFYRYFYEWNFPLASKAY